MDRNPTRAARLAVRAALVAAAVALLALIATGKGRSSSESVSELEEWAAAAVAGSLVQPPLPGACVTARGVRDLFPN